MCVRVRESARRAHWVPLPAPGPPGGLAGGLVGRAGLRSGVVRTDYEDEFALVEGGGWGVGGHGAVLDSCNVGDGEGTRSALDCWGRVGEMDGTAGRGRAMVATYTCLVVASTLPRNEQRGRSWSLSHAFVE